MTGLQIVLTANLLLLLVSAVSGFSTGAGMGRMATKSTRLRQLASPEREEQYTSVPGLEQVIRPSITDKARTITHICTSGTLCTTSVMDGVEGAPFGSFVDYILDEIGWPVLLLSEQSLHSVNIKQNPLVSLFCQLPRSTGAPGLNRGPGASSQESQQQAAALSRVTIVGSIVPVAAEDLSAIKTAFTLVHPYADQIADSPKFSFCKIKPAKIYFSGGFGVMATWVDVPSYELARPDVLAQEVPTMLARLNVDKQGELYLLSKHFLGESEADVVRIQAIDRLGIDLRVKVGEFTDEYRLGFRNSVNSAEDAKSEVMKLFQEAWERESGFFYTDTLPPVTKYAEDILRSPSQQKGDGAGSKK